MTLFVDTSVAHGLRRDKGVQKNETKERKVEEKALTSPLDRNTLRNFLDVR